MMMDIQLKKAGLEFEVEYGDRGLLCGTLK